MLIGLGKNMKDITLKYCSKYWILKGLKPHATTVLFFLTPVPLDKMYLFSIIMYNY